MNWIGRTTESTQVIYVWHTVDAQSIDDLKTRAVTVGSSGVNSPSTIIPKVLNYTIGTKMKIVLGYKGSSTFNLAVERRETDASLTTWGNLKKNYAHWLKDKKIRILTQILLSRHPDLPNVPTAIELAKNDDDRALLEFVSSSAELGQAFIAPQGVPANIVTALRRAFDATMKDPDYQKASERVGNSVNPMSGEELDKFAARTLATPKSVIERYRAALAVH
jgi:tripartite-type tricarboxylate transporter receptor subunit TctC